MARFLYVALVVCVGAMYMAYAAPSPQGIPPLAPPAGTPPLAPPAGTPEAPANNVTGPAPHNCTEFVQKCTTLQGSDQFTAGSNTAATSLGPLGQIIVAGSKYDCAAASVSCNGTAPAAPPPPAIPTNPGQTPPAAGGQTPPAAGGQTPPATGGTRRFF